MSYQANMKNLQPLLGTQKITKELDFKKCLYGGALKFIVPMTTAF